MTESKDHRFAQSKEMVYIGHRCTKPSMTANTCHYFIQQKVTVNLHHHFAKLHTKGRLCHQFTLPNVTENAHLYSLDLNMKIVYIALFPFIFVTVKCVCQVSRHSLGRAEENDENPR
jgi:hypothetical protein